MKRKLFDLEEGAKKAVRWADKTKFEEVKAALREKDIASATSILRSLSTEEALEVLYKNDGQVVIDIIKLAYREMKHHRYNTVEFKDLYSILIDLNEEYFNSMVDKAINQIMAKTFFQMMDVNIYRVSSHIGEVRLEKATLKASSSKADCKSESSESDVSHVTDDKETTVAPDDSLTSDKTGQKDQDIDCSTKDKHDTASLESDTIQYSNDESVFYNKKTAESDAQSSSMITGSNYFINFFFGWLNALPSFIQESIKQNSAFQVFLENYKEIQSMLIVNQNEIILPSIEEVIDKNKSVNYIDDFIDQENIADIKFDQSEPIDMDNILDPSLLAILPTMTLSGIRDFDYSE